MSAPISKAEFSRIRLARNFTMAEAMRSQNAARYGIDNRPGDAEIINIKRTARGILQPVRDHYGIPFSPSSWFRNPEVNRLAGSVNPNSQHITGHAVDFEVPGISNLEVAEWIRDNLTFDQLILEFWSPDDPASGCVHVSLVAEGNRGDVTRYNRHGFRGGLHD